MFLEKVHFQKVKCQKNITRFLSGLATSRRHRDSDIEAMGRPGRRAPAPAGGRTESVTLPLRSVLKFKFSVLTFLR